MLKKIYENIIPYEQRLNFYKLRNPSHFRELRSRVFPSDKGDFSLKPFDLYKCIFVHVTKTAGTSVAKSLFGYLPYHYTAIQYRVIYGKSTFEKYFKFAFVRNPWDRLYSAYRYLKAGGWNESDNQWSNENLSEFNDFNEFVTRWLSKENIHKHIHFKPQHEFLCDSKSRLLVDYLAYFETLQDDYVKIANKLKTGSSLGEHNINPSTDGYKKIYTEETKKIVQAVYRTDIELFGYNFEGINKRNVINEI